MTAATSGTLGPERRTMPTPPRPGGVAAATMVSVRVIWAGPKATAGDTRKGSGAGVGGTSRAAQRSGSGSFRRHGRLDAPVDVPLLRNRQDGVGHPVEHQSRREKRERGRHG